MLIHKADHFRVLGVGCHLVDGIQTMAKLKRPPWLQFVPHQLAYETQRSYLVNSGQGVVGGFERVGTRGPPPEVRGRWSTRRQEAPGAPQNDTAEHLRSW